MSAKNTSHSFGYVAKSFHWIVAVLIIAMLCLGYLLEDFPASSGAAAYNVHKCIGIIILALVVLRLVWRWMNIQPGYSSRLPACYKLFVKLAHYVIYMAMVLMPLSGWLMSTAAGRAPDFFGWFYFPMPGIALNTHLAGVMYQVHNTLAVVLIVLISLHILAGLFHHVMLRDNVLKRMLPGGNRG